jgi:hypothetical protein
LVYFTSMADDKGASGGGSGWGALEIILGLLLLIGVLDRVTGRHASPSQPTTSTPNIVQEDPSDRCGIELSSPSPSDRVRSVIRLAGFVGSCNWRTTATVALYAQVVDAKGKVVTGYLSIPPSSTSQNQERVSFDQTIALTRTPATGIGYLILVPAVPPDTEQTVSLRIPLSL